MADPNNTDVELPDLSDEAKAVATDKSASTDEDGAQKFATDLQAVYDVHVSVSAVLGKTNMEVSELLKLGRGAIVELDRKIGEAIDIYVNNRLVARGEVVVVEDRLGITMTEIVKGGLQ
jgi:flagellar motor switch protein FliN/FliY